MNWTAILKFVGAHGAAGLVAYEAAVKGGMTSEGAMGMAVAAMLYGGASHAAPQAQVAQPKE